MSTNLTVTTYIIISGDPENGFWYMGPFKTTERAHAHAICHMRPENTWWIAELLTPDKHEGRL